jgi:Rod binding domain-containing protein
MITRIAPNAPSSLAETKLDASSIKEGPAAPKKIDPKIAHVASQFEEVFARQLLSSAKMGGESDGGGGYSAMTIDALATGVTKGGGLGIAQSIEMALSHSSGPAAPIAKAPQTPEKPE